MRTFGLTLLALTLLHVVLQPARANETVESLAQKAVSAAPSESSRAIEELRALGPNGLRALIDAHQLSINHRIEKPMAPIDDDWLRLSSALDAVSQQRDSYVSGLFWYTDFEAAKRAALQSGKPILSLRLLGKLTDEFSCANSRFFRVALYANASVSNVLRERFILHWQAVRNVPRITIDFGDGRKLERTITGNSIHYVLDSEGRPIDGLPGLYGPAAFLKVLGEAEQVFHQLKFGNRIDRHTALVNFHRARINAISVAWARDTQSIGGKLPERVRILRGEGGDALAVAELAATKALTEVTILRSMTAGADALGRITDEEAWRGIAALHAADAKLDGRSVSLITRQTHQLLASESSAWPDALKKLVARFEQNLALDSVRNEFLLHVKLHALMGSITPWEDVEPLNEKVYAELFMTPRSDPWLGLLAADTYTALQNGGVVKE